MNASSTSITIIRDHLHDPVHHGRIIPIKADRWQMAKLRWRGTAADGREFGFELTHPLQHGDAVWTNDYGIYVVEQAEEDVLIIPRTEGNEIIAMAWAIGNLHQPLQVTENELIAADDPGLRQLFAQQNISFETGKRVFQPIRSVISHHHHEH